MSFIQLLDEHFLTPALRGAKASPRRRTNINLHAGPEANCQRLFIAMEPDSYVVPHRHSDAEKEETLVVVRGRLAVLCFDDAGQISQRHILAAGSACFGVQVPLGVWHSVIALESGTVFLEAKGGPYRPLATTDFAPWAPREGTPEVAGYLARLNEDSAA